MYYKKAEYETVSKMSESITESPNIGRLRRIKEKLEFRIATEAHTLDAERALIRKVNEVDKEFNEALKVYRIRRKVGLVKGDIEQLERELGELDKKMEESNSLLDTLYSELRSLTNVRRQERDRDRDRPARNREQKEEPKAVSISLEDIAVIKKRPSKAK